MDDLTLVQEKAGAEKVLELYDGMLSLTLLADGHTRSVGYKLSEAERVELVNALQGKEERIATIVKGMEDFFKVFDEGIITLSEFKGLYPELWARLSQVIVKSNIMEVWGA